LGHVRLAITGEATGIQPFQSEDGSLVLLHNGEIYNYRDLAQTLPQDRLKTGSDSEVLLRLIEQHYNGDLEATLKTVLPMLDGVFALAVTDQKETVLIRDRIGVRQLYYVETDDGTLGFASERKPLLRIAGSNPTKRLLPGEMMTIDSGEKRLFRYFTPESLRSGDKIDGLEKALARYGDAITSAVRKRVRGRSRVGIIFSGGIDSVLVAHLVKAEGVPFTCYAAGREEGSGDLEWAQRIADELGYPLKSARLSLSDIETLVPEIIRDIEDNCLNQVEVAVPIYAAVRMAQENGERVLLNGQGADELFGGYPWYSAIVGQEGYGSFLDRSWEDTRLLYKECLEREDKISMTHSIELRVPFLDPEVVEAAFAIDPRLKIKSPEDTLRKWIHRTYSESVGIPSSIAFRPKEAAQHGANVHSAFEEIALRNGYSRDAVAELGYDSSRTVVEMLGSSSRYGYRYGEQDLWEPMPHVQLYLDRIAREQGVLAEDIVRYLDGLDQPKNSSGPQRTLEEVK
jgi:asparagine synthase (glutamine-hydrolysing)